MNVTVQRCQRIAHPGNTHLHTTPEVGTTPVNPRWLSVSPGVLPGSAALREGRILPGLFGRNQVGQEVLCPPEVEHLNRPVVQECTERFHPSRPHRHFTHNDNGNVLWTLNDDWVLPQYRIHDGYSEEPGRFGKGEHVSHGVTPPAEHGSRPEWPVQECTYGHVHPVHYHVTRDNWGDRDPMWNGTIHENGGYHTEQGRRFAKGEHLPATTPEWSEAHE
jgi:hypothetical protein